MRIVSHKYTVRSILFSRVMGFLYFLGLLFFIYKCVMLVPIWLTAKEKSEEARQDYEKRVTQAELIQESKKNSETEMGRERYQKDFFNKLDEGEHLIVLYNDRKVEKRDVVESRKMFWWEELQQDFLVWWRNLKS